MTPSHDHTPSVSAEEQVPTPWSPWSEARPTRVGYYWWRLPKAVYGGVTLRPEWVCEVALVGMGYGEDELWPRLSDWDGYRRTVPGGLEWRGEGDAQKGAYVFPGLTLNACPFCGSSPTLEAHDLPVGGGSRLYITPFRPNRFKVGCAHCGMANSFGTPDLGALVDRWNARAAIAQASGE